MTVKILVFVEAGLQTDFLWQAECSTDIAHFPLTVPKRVPLVCIKTHTHTEDKCVHMYRWVKLTNSQQLNLQMQQLVNRMFACCTKIQFKPRITEETQKARKTMKYNITLSICP